MIKVIQTIALATMVFSPLSLISLISSATAHHTSSHVSTVSVTTTKASNKKIKKGAKPAATANNHQQPAPNAMTQLPTTMPLSESMPVK